MTIVNVLAVLVFAFGTTYVLAENSLELVQVVFRHGDRSPVDAYPTDVYKEDYWPQGFGQLTKVGMNQHYELGGFFKKRYVDDMNFLKANYSRYQIVIWSTDVDRTLMSAAVDLSGFFPPQGPQIWNPNITWQPIPIHTMPQSEDYYLSYSADCPKYDELQNQSLNDKDYVDLSKEYATFMKDLNSNSGFNGSITITNIYKVADPLNVQKIKKLNLPKWTEKEGFWKTLVYLSTWAMGQPFNSTAKSRLRGGPMVGKLISNMVDSMNDSIKAENKMKFHMYSAHDITVASLLCALGVFDDILPPYASAVGVELWKHDKDYSVRVWYRNDTTHEPYNLTLPGCEVYCPYQKFVDLTKDIALAEEDIRKACGLEVTPMNYWIPTIIGIMLGVLLFICVAGYLLAISRKENSGHTILQNQVGDPW